VSKKREPDLSSKTTATEEPTCAPFLLQAVVMETSRRLGDLATKLKWGEKKREQRRERRETESYISCS